jgi:hypothetical protein
MMYFIMIRTSGSGYRKPTKDARSRRKPTKDARSRRKPKKNGRSRRRKPKTAKMNPNMFPEL